MSTGAFRSLGREGDSHRVNRLQRLIQDRADERGWSLAHVGTRGGLNRQTVYKIMRAERLKQLPDDATFEKLAAGLDLPERLLRDAAAESIGIRIYDESVTDADTRIVIATMEKLPPGRRRQLRKMAELWAEEYLGGKS
jgi:transcriptional regulator with XRE-family HTH domain